MVDIRLLALAAIISGVALRTSSLALKSDVDKAEYSWPRVLLGAVSTLALFIIFFWGISHIVWYYAAPFFIVIGTLSAALYNIVLTKKDRPAISFRINPITDILHIAMACVLWIGFHG